MRFGSLEVRWFFAGTPAPDAAAGEDPVVSWFRTSRPLPTEGAGGVPAWPRGWREDVYGVLAGHDDLGMKWRREADGGSGEERFEFKGRVAHLGDVSLGVGPQARLERWMKWSVPASAAPPGVLLPFETGRGAGLVTVRKRRMLRTVRLDDDGGAAEITTAGSPPTVRRGLEFELTRGEAGGEPFWTLAAEAFPWEPRVREHFARLVTRLLEGWPGPPLALERSLSYPAWLQRFV